MAKFPKNKSAERHTAYTWEGLCLRQFSSFDANTTPTILHNWESAILKTHGNVAAASDVVLIFPEENA